MESSGASFRVEFVRIEGDAKTIIEKVKARSIQDAVGGALLEEIQQLLSATLEFRLQFVGRQYNTAGHMVARKTLSLFPTGCNNLISDCGCGRKMRWLNFVFLLMQAIFSLKIKSLLWNML
ncbi:unnamed protein product [Linum trigynum]|uniref:RNase H type-1 domain-containing protein n=1 Tax=Linum trigynum TaxID=586398 RepID=A0AAV2FB90_9ROSI